MKAKFGYRMKGFAPSTPTSSFRANFASAFTIPSIMMWTITAEMGVCDIIQRPEKLNANSFPRLLVFNAQIIYIFNFLRAFKTNVLAILLKEMKQHHFSEAIAGRSMRNA
ncbi:MAG TPA: hypothetical protein VF528_03045 [Pyrinomonadaceae bacterium]